MQKFQDESMLKGGHKVNSHMVVYICSLITLMVILFSVHGNLLYSSLPPTVKNRSLYIALKEIEVLEFQLSHYCPLNYNFI